MPIGRWAHVVALATLATLGMPDAARCDPLTDVVDDVRAELDPKAAGALDRIDGAGRKLLAARSYLRAGRELATRWSWTAEEIAAYEKSDEHTTATAEVDKVIAAFEQANPDYTLYVNRRTRSLDTQIAAWNTNASVGAAAATLETAVRAELAKTPTAGMPAAQVGERSRALLVARSRVLRVARWRAFLMAARPTPAPSLAAPGLSSHGQLRAYDFQIQRKNGPIVARTNTGAAATEWDDPGWTAKLAAAVKSAGSCWKGPLEFPREPWHYDYQP